MSPRVACAALLLSAVPALAHENDPAPADGGVPVEVHTTVISAARPFTSASSFSVRDRDFMIRPHPRPADILQVVPGLYVNQHAGGGKANQYFLRGFDADHGTDVALSVDGVPVNLVSHGHGQGYADLNWVIPELIEKVEVRKGPYFAQDGDLATAGAINLVTRSVSDMSSLTLSGGSFDTWRGLAVVAPQIDGWSPIIAAQASGANGPFANPEALQKFTVFSKLTHALSEHTSVSVGFTSYTASWNASGQLPLREVEAGRLARFGTLDKTDGGKSERHSLTASLRSLTPEGGEVNAMAYAAFYRLALFSNFTFFSADAEHGDQIEQTDERVFAGAKASYRFVRRLGGFSFDTTAGTQLRVDDIHNALFATQARRRLETKVRAEVREGTLGLYVQEEVGYRDWARLVLGLRADAFLFGVEDRRTAMNSGSKPAGIVSPKASLVFGMIPNTELYVNAGTGFHSNDARAVLQADGSGTPAARAIGGEVGARTRLFDRVELMASAFLLDLQSELVWVGDGGGTEARGATRRVGVEAEARVKLLSWLTADLDFTWADAKYADGTLVALAPTLVVQGGVSARHPRGPYGRIGVMHLGDRPATEDGFLTAQGFTRVDAAVGFKHRRFDVAVGVQNLLNTQWREAQFANVSRLPHEMGPASCPAGTRAAEEGGSFLGCEDLHFTPGAPVNVEVTASVFF